METTLHRQLKALYCSDTSHHEVSIDGYRIDVCDGDQLIEIQCASLFAIRDKVRRLLDEHRVLVVKPLAVRKILIKRNRKDGRVVSSRYSPRRETLYDLFEELVHFVNVFPHPNLTLELLLTEQEEHRLPARKRRWRSKGYRVTDRRLLAIQDRFTLRTARDLVAMLPDGLPMPFTTDHIARQADIPRWLSQKMAYCLRKTGACQTVGKQGNSLLYQFNTVERLAG